MPKPTLSELIEAARAAQQENEQKHDVQLALVALTASPKKADREAAA